LFKFLFVVILCRFCCLIEKRQEISDIKVSHNPPASKSEISTWEQVCLDAYISTGIFSFFLPYYRLSHLILWWFKGHCVVAGMSTEVCLLQKIWSLVSHSMVMVQGQRH